MSDELMVFYDRAIPSSCRMLRYVERAAEDRDDVSVRAYDFPNAIEAVTEYDVFGVPTTILRNGRGEVLARHLGCLSVERITGWMEDALEKSRPAPAREAGQRQMRR